MTRWKVRLERANMDQLHRLILSDSEHCLKTMGILKHDHESVRDDCEILDFVFRHGIPVCVPNFPVMCS